MGASLTGFLEEVRKSEEVLLRFHRTAKGLSDLGALTSAQRMEFESYRQRVYGTERILYNALTSALRYVAGSLVPAAIVEEILGQLPEPEPYPSLDAAPLGAGPDSGADFAAVPAVVVWAVAVVAVISAIAAVYAAIRAAEVGGEVVADFIRTRENTERYVAQLEEQRMRYEACIAAGTSMEECAQAFPVPDAPQEPPPAHARTSLMPLFLVGGGILLVAGGAFYWYYKKQRNIATKIFSGPTEGPRALSSTEVRSALGSYGLEVEG